MIIKGEGIIKEIRDQDYRGINNYKIRGIILEVNLNNYYVEAFGDFCDRLDNYNVNQPIKFELEYKTPQNKNDPDKYWTNVNIVDITTINPNEEITEIQASIDAQQIDDDLPF